MKNLSLSLLLIFVSLVFATTARAQAPEQAPQFQINTTHTGSSSENLTPPLTQRWVVNFGRSISYPLIVDGKVYVTVENASGQGTTLFALNATNGATVWSFSLDGSFPWSATCYENGRVFALNGNGFLRAFDAATGSVIWGVQIASPFSIFDAPPTVFQGVIFISGSLNVYAINANTGALLWKSQVINGDTSSPAVTNQGVWVSYACPNVYKLDPTTERRSGTTRQVVQEVEDERPCSTTDDFMSATFRTLFLTARQERSSAPSMRRIVPPFRATGVSF